MGTRATRMFVFGLVLSLVIAGCAPNYGLRIYGVGDVYLCAQSGGFDISGPHEELEMICSKPFAEIDP